MEITIKNLKVSRVALREGYPFTASVYVNGKRAFAVENRAAGGCNWYTPFDPADWPLVREAEAYAKTLPAADTPYGPLDMNLDLLISELVEAEEMRRECRKKTLFRSPDQGPFEYYTIKTPYNERVKAHIEETYPGSEIFNERYI